MKILNIRIQNLNSLKGEHYVDLASEPLSSAGLFAITGPTGAGKSTILDAVTLALYGRAARYGNESNPEHVMSRHCGECSAEVEFQVPSGIYRAVWQRHRSRNKPGGKLQQPKRYIYNQDGESLAQQIREAEAKIEELLGLDYGRFLRSVLLAQGDFARFLKSNANERAELLESLTGTEIYSQLGILAFEEATRRQNDLELKSSGLDQIKILEKEERIELEKAVDKGDAARMKLAGQIKSGSDDLDKIKSLEAARRNEKEAVEKLSEIADEEKSAAAKLESLRRHRLTIPFEADLARLEAAESSLTTAKANRELAEDNHSKARQDLTDASNIFSFVLNADLKDEQQRADEAKGVVSEEKKNATKARQWLDKHKKDGDLENELPDLVAKISDLKNTRNTSSRDWLNWKELANKALGDAEGKLPETLEGVSIPEFKGTLDKIVKKSSERLKEVEKELKTAKKNLKLRRDHLEKVKLVAKLEDHRHLLTDEEPCPLCGALEHPYAKGAEPAVELKELESEVDKAIQAEEDLKETHQALKGTTEDLKASKAGLLVSVGDYQDTQTTLESLLKPVSEKIPKPGREDNLQDKLKDRAGAYRDYVKADESANKRSNEAKQAGKDASREIKELNAKIEKLQSSPNQSKKKKLDDEDLPSLLDAEENCSAAIQEEKTTAVQVRDRKTDEKEAGVGFKKLKDKLASALVKLEFNALEELHKARLDEGVAEEIEDQEDELKKGKAAAGALLKKAQKEIADLLKEKVLEGEVAKVFKAKQEQLRDESDKVVEELANRRNDIKLDDDNRKLRRQREKELGKDRKELEIWGRLRELIGSSDGRKFRRHAQAISLDILTGHANRHLSRLSDRYLICRDKDEALNLQIEDMHQAGALRPMNSLSGGESFLASLALALGLSDIAGRNIRIDSLFIDEGFGSLDYDTLEIALSALESLRQEHKTVGVISHVDLLKERIGTQIEVYKLTGGDSKIRILPQINRI
jgi:exonuclease SbcC